jgi:alkylated DNA repair protein (DNA oxidative demethylase)
VLNLRKAKVHDSSSAYLFKTTAFSIVFCYGHTTMAIDETTPVNLDLFSDQQDLNVYIETICPDAVIIRHLACQQTEQLISAISDIAQVAPFRNMTTPNGASMSAAMTNCGDYGWVSDHSGYRYAMHDPVSGKAWPPIPTVFIKLAQISAKKAGFNNFTPNACLINRYPIGSRMGLHQDKDEHDLTAPIVSVSLGIPATFLFGGLKRKDQTTKVQLGNGDVVVFGGVARLNYHGIATIKDSVHQLTKRLRYNLTFRLAT